MGHENTAHRQEWLPRRESDLMALQARWTETLSDTTKQTAYGWPAADCTATTGKIAAFTTAWGAYNDDKSPEKRIAKDEAKEESIDAMRDFANERIRYNRAMSVDAKAFLGIGPHDTVPSPHPIPASVPNTDVRNTENHYEHKVSALNSEGKASKPHDAYGVRYACQVGGERPASGADLPRSQFSRKPSITIAHTEADKGKTAYYSTCYENSKGQQGGYSPIIEAVIG